MIMLCIRARLPLGVFYTEFGKHKDAMEIFESLINMMQIELSLRISRNKDKNKELHFFIKLKKKKNHSNADISFH